MRVKERNGSEVKGKRVEFRVSADLFAAAQDIADQLGGLSINAIATMALASYVRNWSAPWKRKGKHGQEQRETALWKSGWPKDQPCPGGCGREHDPIEHPEHTLAGMRVVAAMQMLKNPPTPAEEVKDVAP